MTHGRLPPWDFEPDQHHAPVIALRHPLLDTDSQLQTHAHRKGQLVLALEGWISCESSNGLWIVPPGCAVWVPGQVPHAIRVSAHSDVCFLFIDPEAASLPSDCCSLSITPFVREAIVRLAQTPRPYTDARRVAHLVAAILDDLVEMHPQTLHLPISADPRLRRLAGLMVVTPAVRRGLADWAAIVGLSPRSLARLVISEIGMTFGRWRQQAQVMVALRLLAAGASVQRVSEDLGYESVSAFITMFKKTLGQSPARYIAAKRGVHQHPSLQNY